MSRSLKIAAVVSVGTVVLIYGIIEHGQRLRATAPLRELPSTARAVLRIDTDALRATPAAARLLESFVAKEQLSEIEKSCEIAPIEALGAITVWVRGPEDQPFQSIGLMLQGRTVDAARLVECHRSLVQARGGSVVRVDAPMGPLLASRDRRSAVALVDDRTIVTGSVRTVAETMEAAAGLVPTLTDRAAFAALWRQVGPRSAVAAVLEPPAHWREALGSLGDRSLDRAALEGVRALGLAIRSGSKRNVEVYVDLLDPSAASRDAAEIEAWLRDPPGSIEPPWADVLRAARLQLKGAMIQIRLDVSGPAKAREELPRSPPPYRTMSDDSER
jgi:hypothetical protein